MYKEINGDLIALAKQGHFDFIAHGCNCFCMQGAGIAKGMSENFRTSEYPLEHKFYRGKMNKLGTLDYKRLATHPTKVETYFEDEAGYHKEGFNRLIVVNAYTQFNGGNNADLFAIALCLKKLNYVAQGKRVGLPAIGAGIGGADLETVKGLMKKLMTDCDLTLVLYDR